MSLILHGSAGDGVRGLWLRNATTDTARYGSSKECGPGIIHECFRLKCYEDGSFVMCSTEWLTVEELQV